MQRPVLRFGSLPAAPALIAAAVFVSGCASQNVQPDFPVAVSAPDAATPATPTVAPAVTPQVTSAATPAIAPSSAPESTSAAVTEPVRQFASSASRVRDVPLPELFITARELVESHTSADLSAVVLNIADDSLITLEVAHETKRLVTHQFDNSQFAQHFLSAVMDGQAGTYAALYASRTNQVMISQTLLDGYRRSLPDDAELRNSALLALLIHELVHAADDQKYRIHENRTLNFRASFAQSAAFEGHAQWMTRRICAEAGCADGLTALDNFMFSRGNPPNQLTQTVQAISRNVLEYSYVEGERFLAALAERENGDVLIDRLLSSPPTDPIQILNPVSYPDTSRERRNRRLLEANGSIDHPWQQTPWARVETSPLKGVNLRADPARRQAAVDGFTRLITAMVALQLYNQSDIDEAPIEVTLLQTDTDQTADLFAQTLHENTRIDGFSASVQPLLLPNSSVPTGQLFATTDNATDRPPYITLIARAGRHVVQIAGQADPTLMRRYAAGTLSAMAAR